jgi:amino acid transporter
MAVISFFVVVGLFKLRREHKSLHRPFKIWSPLAIVYLFAQILLLLSPFIPPDSGKGDADLPYWLPSSVGVTVLACGVLYWYIWWLVLPRLRNSV